MTWILTNKRISLIIALFLCLLISLGYANRLKGKLNKADQKQIAAVIEAVKPYEMAIAKAQAEALAKEKIYNDNLLKAEQNAIKEIKAANDDADRAADAAVSLSEQLAKAKRNMPTASCQAIVKYVEIESDVLKQCVAEYREMAKAADGERIDKERLSGAWPQ
ncbi:hypothetical protein EC844_12517 [Acinetobacter calcoaceticus]|uniref:Uncharacterized protein n=1 Tax=Acinetobacter calcoaceticus TaxID=471 RepID=A0A4R1XGN0_ACICA|nr:hypothetical protein EC844_12517 [Acinetobacter calcoaceticus]